MEWTGRGFPNEGNHQLDGFSWGQSISHSMCNQQERHIRVNRYLDDFSHLVLEISYLFGGFPGMVIPCKGPRYMEFLHIFHSELTDSGV